eukprot:IDg15837t1
MKYSVTTVNACETVRSVSRFFYVLSFSIKDKSIYQENYFDATRVEKLDASGITPRSHMTLQVLVPLTATALLSTCFQHTRQEQVNTETHLE